MDSGRRLFLATSAALAAGVLLPTSADARGLRKRLCVVPAQESAVNITIERIAALLREKKVVECAEVRKAPNATKAIVQWQWAHYQPAIDLEYLPHIERVNRELYAAMDAVRAMPEAGFSELMHEGLIKGREGELIDHYLQEQRAIIRNIFTVHDFFWRSRSFSI